MSKTKELENLEKLEEVVEGKKEKELVKNIRQLEGEDYHHRNYSKKMLKYLKGFSSAISSGIEKEFVNANETLVEIKKKQLVLKLALENYQKEKLAVTKKTENFLELILISKRFQQNLEDDSDADFKMEYTPQETYIFIANDDQYSDYDLYYIGKIHKEKAKIEIIFNLETSVKEESLNTHRASRGKIHIIDFSEYVEELEKNLPKEAQRKIKELREKRQKRIEKEKRKRKRKKRRRKKERKERRKEKLNEISALKGKDSKEINFLAEYIVDHGDRGLPTENSCEGQFVAFSTPADFDTRASRSTVKDYKVRTCYLVDLKQKKAKKKKKKVLWRSTGQGITGHDLDGEILDVKKMKDVKEKEEIVIEFKTDTVVFKKSGLEEVKLGPAKNPDPEVRKKIKEKVDEKLKELKENNNLTIQVCNEAVPEGGERDAEVGITSGVRFTSEKEAEVEFFEEIDYRAGAAEGPSIYGIQERYSTFKVTPEKIELVSSETTDYQ